jgi:hypothetical protein
MYRYSILKSMYRTPLLFIYLGLVLVYTIFFRHVYITPILRIHVLLSHENMCSPKFYNTEIYTLPWVNISCTHTRPKKIIVYRVHIQGLSTYTPFIYFIKYISIRPYSFHLQGIITYLFSKREALMHAQLLASPTECMHHVFGGTNTSLAGLAAWQQVLNLLALTGCRGY